MHVLYIDPLSDETKILLGGKKKKYMAPDAQKIHVQMLFKKYGAIIIKFGPFVAFDVFSTFFLPTLLSHSASTGVSPPTFPHFTQNHSSFFYYRVRQGIA